MFGVIGWGRNGCGATQSEEEDLLLLVLGLLLLVC